MFPAQPPLPTAWNFPFHPWAGSQTSILMSESDDGVSVAATRQKAGRRLNCCTAAGPIPGRVKRPAGTIWAKVIEVSGSTRDDKLSHDAPALRVWPATIVARSTAQVPPGSIFMAPSQCDLPNAAHRRSSSSEDVEAVPRLLRTHAALDGLEHALLSFG